MCFSTELVIDFFVMLINDIILVIIVWAYCVCF